MTTQEKIAVMQHYADGGQIELRNDGTEIWVLSSSPSIEWNWSNNEYRIYKEQKPKQTVVIEKWLTTNGYEYFVIEGEKERIRGIFEAKFLVKLLDTYEVEL